MAKSNKSHKWFYITAILLVAGVIAIYFGYIRPHHLTIVSKPPTATKASVASGTKQPTSSTFNQGAATDNNGQTTTPATTTPSQWQQSTTGVITVQQPLVDSTVAPGFTLSGTASVSSVQYRLIDDKVGVISQAIINVVNGKFSANINFKSYGSTGRLDVFSTDPNGKEINEVQINVNFGV